MRVLMTDLDLGDPCLEQGWLTTAGAELRIAAGTDEDTLVREVREFAPDALLVQWARITPAVLGATPNLRLISRIGIGTDMIDHDAAAAAGVEVRNVPHYCTEEVATHAVAGALALWRRLPQWDAQVRAGGWDAAGAADQVRRLSEATVGLVGYGRIGRLVARAFEVWGARVVVHDPFLTECEHPLLTLPDLLAEAEIVSLHAPLTPDSAHLLGPAEFAAMRRRPVLVNASRGGLVDTDALVEALRSGTVSGAALDVYEREPLPPEDPLRGAPNTILTPHAAWCSASALPDLRRGAVENILERAERGAR